MKKLMKNVMKKSVSILLAVLLIGGMSACGADNAAVEPEPAAPPDETIEAPSDPEKAEATPNETNETDEGAEAQALSGDIIFWHSFTQGPRLDSLQKAADDFSALHPEVKITIETFSWGDFYTKWTTGLASGNVPDMSTALPAHVVEMIDADAVIPLDDLIDKIGRDRFYPAPLDEMTVENSTYAVPLYSHAQVMWLRTDLLAAAGLGVPATWDELYETAKALTKDGVYGLSVPMGSGDRMATRFLNFYVRSGGETLLTADRKANLTSQIAIDGINYWVKMYKDCSPGDSVNYKVLDQATLYYQGKTAFDFNSAFQIGGVEGNAPELLDYIDCAPMPKIKAEDPTYGIETSNIPMVVWQNSAHPEVCKAFIEFIYEDERYIEFLEATPVGMLPALNDITDTERYLSNPTVRKYANAVKVISDAVAIGTEIGFEYGPCPEASILTSQNVIEEMFQDIVVNGTDVETAAKAAEDKLNSLFLAVQ